MVSTCGRSFSIKGVLTDLVILHEITYSFRNKSTKQVISGKMSQPHGFRIVSMEPHAPLCRITSSFERNWNAAPTFKDVNLKGADNHGIHFRWHEVVIYLGIHIPVSPGQSSTNAYRVLPNIHFVKKGISFILNFLNLHLGLEFDLFSFTTDFVVFAVDIIVVVFLRKLLTSCQSYLQSMVKGLAYLRAIHLPLIHHP